MTDPVPAIIGPVVEYLMVPVKKHLGYLFLSTEHLRKLSAAMKQLEGTSVDVENHKDRNNRENLEIPARVPGWLEEELPKIKTDSETILSNGNGGCFNIKQRYQTGRKAWKTTQEIERLLQEGLAFIWTDAQKPLGRVYTTKASTSAPLPSPSSSSSSSSSSGGDSIGEAFKSRATTFDDALKLLQQDQKTTQVIALCGMGGVGKTTMMLQLKKVAEEKKMFDWILKVVIGNQPNWLSIQQVVAENLGNPLTEETQTTRADRLRTRFEETLKKSEKGILVILDDVWEKVQLKDIGLSPLPNRVKLLLTSRNEEFCEKIAVHEGNLDLIVLKVGVLEDEEARKFFCQITKISKESDRYLYQIGGKIVKKCSYLPLAIKLIAPTLRSKNKAIWRDRLRCLEKKGPHPDVQEIIKISYNYLDEEEYKEILLLCGLFPEDANIPMEDLTKYAWGLNLFKGISTFGEARDATITCVSSLKKASLLIDGDFPECVKMHDLVLAFVLATLKTSDHASFINHEGSSEWSGEGMMDSCKKISLACTGMSEFPEDFKCPNVSLLKLMHRHDPSINIFKRTNDRFKFPEGFYENTEKLQVIAHGRMQYPLLPRSLQSCSTNLRTLCLHECSLMFDISFIGDLSNLEVLSITECGIRKLPSAIAKLNKLRVLDLTGCLNLFIDDGVLERLVNLEELYMLGTSSGREAVRFTNANVDELVRCSKNLTSLAIVFNDLPKNISFEKLERFKISLGYSYTLDIKQSRYRFENTLKLVIDKCKILDSMNKLFDKVEVLHLELNGVNDHQDALAVSLHHHQSSFYNVRVLTICNCQNLRYLFTVPVANGLGKLERLEISSCSVLETVIDGNIEGGVGEIKFQELKFLSLYNLPNLKSLYNVAYVIELPQLSELHLYGLPKFTSIYPSATCSMSSNISEGQSLLNEEVVVPNLEKQHIHYMENLKEIWPCQFGSSQAEVNVCKLRKLDVDGCNSLVNLFPSNPMSLLHHLEELSVENCGSIEVLFNIDLECAGNIDEARCCLRSIRALRSENLRHVWSIKGANDFDGVIRSFQAIERIEIDYCQRFRNVFTPTTTNFEMRELKVLNIVFGNEEQEINHGEISKVDDTTSDVVFSSNLIRTFNHVRELCISNHERAEVVFEIETPCAENTKQSLLLPDLKRLKLKFMERMSHVWKCSWNKQQPQGSSSSFHNLTTISLFRCYNIKYLFSPLIAKLLSNLQKIFIDECYVIEEVVSDRDDEDEELVASTSTNTSTLLFPHLDYLSLYRLLNLKRIGGGSGAHRGSKEISSTTSIHDQSKLSQVNDVAWSLCQYSREIHIYDCQALPYVIPSYALRQMQKLEILSISSCESMVEIFETQGFNITNFDEGRVGNDATMVAQRMKKINVPPLSNLKELDIQRCDLLHHVFTVSTLESLTQLEKLRISDCKAMGVIMKVDNGEQTMKSSKVVVFSRLKSIALHNLPSLKGFFLEKNIEFHWQLLDDVTIKYCPQMMMFTSGCSITPKLNYIHTELGKHSTLECGLNFRVMAATLHESPFTSLDTTNSCTTTSERMPWSFHNLIEMDIDSKHIVKKIIPSNELLQLQKLEKISVSHSHTGLEEIFEALEGSELQSVVKIPNLREMVLRHDDLEYIHKPSMMVLEFPNLTKVEIDGCNRLEHVFSSSMVNSLLQLQVLRISWCLDMEVIVKGATAIVEEGEGEGECDEKVNEIITLPQLKYLKLEGLRSLKGFYLGKEAYSLPSLDALEINGCSPMSVFTRGDLSTPKLKVVDTSFGRCELVKEENLNSFIDTKLKEGFKF